MTAPISAKLSKPRRGARLHDLRTRSAGLSTFIQVHIEMDPEMRLARAHRSATRWSTICAPPFPAPKLIIHQDPEGLEGAVPDLIAQADGRRGSAISLVNSVSRPRNILAPTDVISARHPAIRGADGVPEPLRTLRPPAANDTKRAPWQGADLSCAGSGTRSSCARGGDMDQTSIQRLISGVLLVIFLVALAAGSTGFYLLLRHQAVRDAEQQARVLLAAAMGVRGYTDSRILPALAPLAKGQFHEETVPSFAAQTVLKSVVIDGKSYSYREPALNPTSPADRATPFEVDLIRRFTPIPG